MPHHLNSLPSEVMNHLSDYLVQHQDYPALAETCKTMHSIFHNKNLHAHFLESVAYGQQVRAEKLLHQVFQGQPEKIQAALRHQGIFTDYSGRTFNCSAYEYAYWAKDIHMCQLLEAYMDEDTKALMLTHIETNDTAGLTYQQNGQAHRSAHFNLTALKVALQLFIDAFEMLVEGNHWHAMRQQWLLVGKAQRDMPAYLFQEYYNTSVASSFSGLGSKFALSRGEDSEVSMLAGNACRITTDGDNIAAIDLAAITCLDKAKTAHLAQSRKHLNPPAYTHGLGV